MGGWLSGGQKEEMGGVGECPQLNVDENHIGDVYLAFYKQETPVQNETVIEKRRHSVIIVDVAGASNDTTISGILLHLAARLDEGGRTRFDAHYLHRERKIFPELYFIGKIKNEYYQGDPSRWATKLTDAAHDWYNEYVASSSTKEHKWSSSVNCNKYARFVLEKFGLRWPEDRVVVGDDYPRRLLI